jgi:hypothetical protein
MVRDVPVVGSAGEAPGDRRLGASSVAAEPKQPSTPRVLLTAQTQYRNSRTITRELHACHSATDASPGDY